MSVYLAYNLLTYRSRSRSTILQMFPYIITIVVVSGLDRTSAPARRPTACPTIAG